MRTMILAVLTILALAGVPAFHAGAAVPQFTERAQAAGLANPGFTFCLAADDFDGDGDVDVFEGNIVEPGFLSPHLPRLYANDGAGNFTLVTDSAFADCAGSQWFDMDADGDLDAVTFRDAGTPLVCYENLGGLQFADVTAQAGLDGINAVNADVCDFDGDSWLDLIVARQAGSEATIEVWCRRGAGFVRERVFPTPTTTLITDAVTVVDWDRDGDPDLLVHDYGAYWNYDPRTYALENRPGEATSFAVFPVPEFPATWSPFTWTDVDLDGDWDFFAGASDYHGGQNHLVLRQGPGAWVDIGGSSGLWAPWLYTSNAAWGDLDLDGYPDLFQPRFAAFAGYTTSRLFRSNGDLTFGDISAALGTTVAQYSNGNAWFDADADGDLDLLVARGGDHNTSYSLDLTTGMFFRNDTAGAGHWLQIDLVGAGGNRHGRGAEVAVHAGGRLLLATPCGGSAPGRAQNPHRITVGLADAAMADSVVVRWRNGRVTRLFDVPADRRLAIAELPTLAFTDVTDSYPGLEDEGAGNSVAWIDFDADGDLDLSVGAGANQTNRLFLNGLAGTGAVSFTSFADPLVAYPATTRGLAWGAFAGADRCPDLYLSAPNAANVLVENTCGSVTDRTDEVTAGEATPTNGVRVVDFDRDGRLDLHELRPEAPDRLLRNLGGWQFEEMPTSALSIVEGSFDAAWGDVDGDGDQDVYVTREAPWPNVMLRNDGGGSFTEVTPSLLAITDRSQGATWGDYDNDGDLDLFVANWDAPNRLFRNGGSFAFTAVTVAGMDAVRRGQSAVWGDLNNDGWLDLYVANQGDPNQLWLNVPDGVGGRTFEDVSYPTVADLGPSTGVGMADYDHDGDLDIYVGAHLGENTLLRNGLQSGNHWLEVDLVATQSNASAIGSRLTVSAGGVTMYREVGANNGMWSQEPTRQHFGLGATAGPVHIAVAWGSGAATELDLASVDRVVVIVEPEVVPQPLTFTDVFADSGFGDWTYVNQANVIDFNGDGWDDLFFARRDGMTPRLFINDRAGRFAEDNDALGALEGQLVEMVDFGDVDNDGDLDILARMADSTLRIFMRDETEYADHTPVSIQGVPFGDVGFIDSDNDGDLDIVGKSESSLSPGQLCLFVNDMMEFSPVVIASDITWIAIADLDGDGLADLVTTDGSSHRVFRNAGSNSFVELANSGLAPSVHYEACIFDYDNDGDFDIYGGNPDWSGRHPRLSRNDGEMVFLDVSQESMSVGQHYYAAALAADPDRDGDLDYYNTLGAWTNGLFFENSGGVFVERSSHYGINVGGGNTTKSGVWIDFDNDHDLDLLVVNTWNANGGWLFRNDIEAGNWLEVQPIATQSNSSLRGVNVTAYWGEASQVQHYEFNPSYYPASRSRTKHFGLGNASVVDSVVVRWPSGVVSVKRGIPANSTIQIQETARPQLIAICDVPDDQGGFLSLTFSAAADGAPDGGGRFSRYDVQRWDNGSWITAATSLAQGIEPYHLIVETQDILTVGVPPRFSKLRIAATTAGQTTMSVSAVDSAYSIDNLPPPKPAATLVEAPDYRYIVWASPDVADFASACVFRGTEAGFTPGEPLTCPSSSIYTETHLAWYFYRVQFADVHGNLSEFSDELHGQWPTGVPGVLPTALRLHPCRPNPFNPRTTIEYDLPETGSVRLAVFDLAGRLVRMLVDENRSPGTYAAAWDGRDTEGREVGSGTYLARLEAGGHVEVMRMALLR